MAMCGGLSKPQEADELIHGICAQVKGDAQIKADRTFDAFEAKSYKTQVVAGTNYFVKVHVGDGEHVHLRIHKGLPHTGGCLTLGGIQHSKTEAEEIVHF